MQYKDENEKRRKIIGPIVSVCSFVCFEDIQTNLFVLPRILSATFEANHRRYASQRRDLKLQMKKKLLSIKRINSFVFGALHSCLYTCCDDAYKKNAFDDDSSKATM